VRHGLVLALLGDPGSLTYKRSRREVTEIDAIVPYVLSGQGAAIAFSPYTRSVNGGYAQYHTSADDLTLIRPDCLAQSLEVCQHIVEVIEGNRRYLNLKPKGEPRLGARGLYRPLGGQGPAEREHALLWILNQSDGAHSLLDIARKSGLAFSVLREAASALETVGLLRETRRVRVSRPQ
jgi:aminopeptidase-like protein